jgi:hypothetical protein
MTRVKREKAPALAAFMILSAIALAPRPSAAAEPDIFAMEFQQRAHMYDWVATRIDTGWGVEPSQCNVYYTWPPSDAVVRVKIAFDQGLDRPLLVRDVLLSDGNALVTTYELPQEETADFCDGREITGGTESRYMMVDGKIDEKRPGTIQGFENPQELEPILIREIDDALALRAARTKVRNAKIKW